MTKKKQCFVGQVFTCSLANCPQKISTIKIPIERRARSDLCRVLSGPGGRNINLCIDNLIRYVTLEYQQPSWCSTSLSLIQTQRVQNLSLF